MSVKVTANPEQDKKKIIKENAIILIVGVVIMSVAFGWYYNDVQKRKAVAEILRGNKKKLGAVDIHTKGDQKSLLEAQKLYKEARIISNDHPVVNSKLSLLSFQLTYYYGLKENKNDGIDLLLDLEDADIRKEERYAAKCFQNILDGQVDQAIQNVKKVSDVVGLKPTFAACLGEAYLIKKDYNKAVENLLAARSMDMKNPLNSYSLALAYLGRWDLPNVSKMSFESLKLNGRMYGASGIKALSFSISERKGFFKVKKEIDDLLTTIDSLSSRDQELTYLGSAALHWKLKEYDKSLEAISKAGTYRTSPGGLWVEGNVLIDSGKVEEGIKLLTDANSTIKDVPKFTLSYLEILAKNGKTELALKGLNEYITKNTKDMKPEDYPLVVYTDKLRIYSSIPNFLSDKKIRPLFDRALNQGLKLDDKNANLAYFKMLTFIEKRKLDQAFAAFQVILAGNPRHYKAFLALGAFLLKKRGFFKDAKAMLDEAIKIRKVKASYKVSETLAEISDLFKKARKKKEAQTYLEMSEKVKQGKEI